MVRFEEERKDKERKIKGRKGKEMKVKRRPQEVRLRNRRKE